MKSYFAYIRVSTQKQGQGVSLQEQRGAIERYAERRALRIICWFEERETAAKRGRPVFGRMLKDLKGGKADGVIIHKIDRSARNLKDWADLGELIDGGYDVHFATETLDLTSRGGRLSADIQAVVAADYIRNLREETRKGFYGRLKQGFYPMRAPLGYLNRGAAKPKEPDPAVAPLVRRAFELYSTGAYSLHTLQHEVTFMGLRNLAGKPLSINGISTLLNNPFYVGIMRIDRTHETFRGVHAPIISNGLFNRVQAVLQGRVAPRTQKHYFLLRRMLRCTHCTRILTGERQKGHVYYSCHTPACPTTGIREEQVDQYIRELFCRVTLTEREAAAVQQEITVVTSTSIEELDAMRASLELQRAQLHGRLDRLVDAYMDKIIDKEAFDTRRNALLFDEIRLKEQATALEHGTYGSADRIVEIFELAKSLYFSYISADPDEKRDLLDRATSNRLVDRKNLEFTLRSPFKQLAIRSKTLNGDPQRDDVRTLARIIADAAKTHDLERAVEKDPPKGLSIPRQA
jgi:site-specific DNA recombinase